MSPTTPTPSSSPEIVARYLAFFRAHDHLELPGMELGSPSLTTSFVIAGMQPMIPFLRGDETPPHPRLVSLQRCLRGDDADAVGTNARKCTSFHMLGNWSIGDYGRHEAIEMARALLDELGLERELLWMTYFGGDPAVGLPPDDATVQEWLRLGIPSARLVPLGLEDNLWTMGGPGPCGPSTELFVDRGEALGCGRLDCRPGCECDRFLEFWNLVFIQDEWLPDGSYEPLPVRSVDTGMGLERIAAVLQGVPTVFDTDLFAPAQARLAALVGEGSRGNELPAHDGQGNQLPSEPRMGQPVPLEERARRMIVDHARATLLAMLAGVEPDHTGRGSVVRRLIRRAARQGRVLGIERPFLGELLVPLARGHESLLTPEERARVPVLARMVTEEEDRFSRVLTAGLRELGRLKPGPDGLIPGERIYALLADRGFPPDLAAEVLGERGFAVEWSGFEHAREAHRAVSRPTTR
jgi:alanyl-tRNA synthetase